MTTGLRVECDIHFHRRAHGAEQLRTGSAPSLPVGGVPRVARLMALALRWDGLVRSGAMKDYTTLARLGNVSTARISQIMNLIHLAPDIQEALLFLPYAQRGRGTVLVADLQLVAALPSSRLKPGQRFPVHAICKRKPGRATMPWSPPGFLCAPVRTQDMRPLWPKVNGPRTPSLVGALGPFVK